ncbi:TetR family transcriptional regulator [Clostridium vincentii]|uniref:HTH tetR-type domain-containing protein n=1 Tax=Clostridium vincentii TaxID=52704 RepID=A0A2T0BIP2_9CLOT|nr:TetR family transcriptional regulator [Clostridium vincentii]PRR83750.1 hypothetical protein CLVI_06970 [Clostridium vincentii]
MNLSIRNISKEIGISSELMFYYFESKEKLYMPLLKEALKGIGIIEKIPESLSHIQIFDGITKTILDIFSRASATIIMTFVSPEIFEMMKLAIS